MRDARIPEWAIDVLREKAANARHWATAVVLYLHADKHGRCGPSESTIAKKVGCSSRTVKRAIRDLESWGLAVVERTEGLANTYRLATRDALVTGDTCVTGADSGPGTPVTRTGDTGDRGPGTPVSPKQEELDEQCSEQETLSGEVCDPEGSDFGDFWAAYPRCESRKRALAAWGRLNRQRRQSATEIAVRMGALVSVGRAPENRYIPLATTFLNGERWEDWADGPPVGWDESSRGLTVSEILGRPATNSYQQPLNDYDREFLTVTADELDDEVTP